MAHRRTLTALVLGAVLLPIGWVGAGPAAAASDQLQDSAKATYELRPDKRTVHVTIDFTFTNRAPSKSRSYSCTQVAFDPFYGYYEYTTTCTTRTDYYYNWYEFWIERDAKNIKAKANSGSTAIRKGTRKGDWRKVRVTFSNLFYGGTRTIRFSYDLLGGAPRSDAERRIGQAYASFCASGPGTDRGSLKVIVPSGFRLTGGGVLQKEAKGKNTVYSMAKRQNPWKVFECFHGSNPDGYTSTPVDIGNGQTVTIEAWMDDRTWSEAVQASVKEDLPKLVASLGQKPFDGDITIRENDPDFGVTDGLFQQASSMLRLSEHEATREAVTHRLATLWFDRDVFSARWLSEAHASWAERLAGVSEAPCTKPTPAEDGTQLKLAAWTRSVELEPDALATHRQAACYVASTVAEAIGTEGMLGTVQALRDGQDPYATAEPTDSEATTDLSEPVGWTEWLDEVEAYGIVPAGASVDLLPDLLMEYGIAFDADILAARAEALEAYRTFIETSGGSAPPVVTSALGEWEFKTAQDGLAMASEGLALTDEIGSTLPGVNALDSDVRATMLTASSLDAERTAIATGQRQLAMATDAADAIAIAAAPRDVVQQVGLIGIALPTEADLVAAVTDLDAERASALADTYRSAIAGARDAGTQRIAAGGVALLLLLVVAVGLVVIVRRQLRQRRHRAETSPSND